jgi:hypothetical protein
MNEVRGGWRFPPHYNEQSQMRLRLPLLLAITLFAGRISATIAVFDNAPTIRMDGYANDIRAADFDHDLKLDFAVVTTHDSKTLRLSVYLGNGDGSFRDPIVNSFTYPVVSAPKLEVADLDGNGLPDAVVGFYGVTAVYPLLGKGNGSFDAMSAVQLPIACLARDFVLADMTNDGRADIVTCGISVVPSLGGGNFGTSITTAAPLGGAIRVLDANGDGKLDIFSGGFGKATLLRGNGNGTFQPDASFPETFTETVATADFDKNGRDDLTFIDELSHDRILMLASAAGQYPERRSMGSVVPLLGADMITPDMNGDSRPDVVAGLGSHVYVWLTQPDGTSLAPVIYLPGNLVRHVVAGDFDFDGKTDLLVHGPGDTQAYDSTYVTLLRGTGNGALRAERGYALSPRYSGGQQEPSFVAGMTLSEITGDGILDLVAVSNTQIAVLPGQSDGSFGASIATPTVMGSDNPYTRPLFGDLDEDGVLDVLIYSNSATHKLQLWLGSHVGTFRRAPGNLGLEPENAQTAFGDFNGDGHLDYVVSLSGYIGYPSTLTVHHGRGDGTFDAPIVSPLDLRDQGLDIQVVDINRDGRDDLVNSRAFRLSLGAGKFERLTDHETDTMPLIADLDGDGHLDLVQYEFHQVSIRLGRGDGTYGLARSLYLHTEGSPAPRVAGDFDGDGDIDVSFGTSVLLGDGQGWFDGYARFRLPKEMVKAVVADLDHNGSADLILIGAERTTIELGASPSIDVIRTRTTTSRELPISFRFGFKGQNSPQLGREFQVLFQEDSPTTFHPGGGALLFYFENRLTSIGDLNDDGARGQLEAFRVGDHPFSAVYSGDEIYARTTAFPGGTINVLRTVPKMTALLNPSPARANEPLHIFGEIYRAVYDLPTSGDITVVVDNGLAGVPTAPSYDVAVGPLAAGVHSLLVQYKGDSSYLYNYLAYNFIVGPGRVTMQFAVTPPAATSTTTPVTLTASFPNDPTLAGNVEFFAGTQSLGQKTISGGAASVTTSLPVGHYTFRATFAGNAQYIETSESIPYTITPGPPRRRPSRKP